MGAALRLTLIDGSVLPESDPATLDQISCRRRKDACASFSACFWTSAIYFPPTMRSMNQKTLAEIVGTTRSRVNFFMTKFRKLGLVQYHKGNAEIILCPHDTADRWRDQIRSAR